jgi:hypothetical protein
MSQLKPKEIEAKHNPVFQTLDSLSDIVETARIALEEGKMTPNRMRILFGCYHNTLLNKVRND